VAQPLPQLDRSNRGMHESPRDPRLAASHIAATLVGRSQMGYRRFGVPVRIQYAAAFNQGVSLAVVSCSNGHRRVGRDRTRLTVRPRPTIRDLEYEIAVPGQPFCFVIATRGSFQEPGVQIKPWREARSHYDRLSQEPSAGESQRLAPYASGNNSTPPIGITTK
jgi:hypothetical protein